MTKKILLGLIPLSLCSIIEPTCNASSSLLNSIKTSNEDEKEVSFEQLEYIYHSGVINYYRLDKKQQIEVNNKIKEEKSESYANFLDKLDYFYKNKDLKTGEKYSKINETCYAVSLKIVDFISVEENLNNQTKSINEVKSSNEVNETVSFCKNNYLLYDEAYNLIDKATIARSISTTSKPVVIFNTGLILKRFLKSVEKSEENKAKLDSIYVNKKVSIDELYQEGKLKVGEDLTDYVKNNELDINYDHENSHFLLPNFHDFEYKDKFDLYVKIDSFNFDLNKGYDVTLNFGLINKDFKNRPDFNDFIIWSNDKERVPQLANSQEKQEMTYYMTPSNEYLQKEVNNAFKQINMDLKPKLLTNNAIGVETYNELKNKGQIYQFDNSSKSYLQFGKSDKAFFDNWDIYLNILNASIDQQQVRYEIKLSPKCMNGQIKFSSTDEQFSSVYTERMPVSKALYANYINRVLLLHEASYLINNFVLGDSINIGENDSKDDPSMYTFFIENINDVKEKLGIMVGLAIVEQVLMSVYLVIYALVVLGSSFNPANWVESLLFAAFFICVTIALIVDIVSLYFLYDLITSVIPNNKYLQKSYKIFTSLKDIKKSNEVYPEIVTDFTNSDEYKKHLENVTNYTFPNEVIINDFLNKMGSPDDTDPSLPMHQWSEINKIIALKNNLSLFNQNGKIINYFSYITTPVKSFGEEYLSKFKLCCFGIIAYILFFNAAIIILLVLMAVSTNRANPANPGQNKPVAEDPMWEKFARDQHGFGRFSDMGVEDLGFIINGYSLGMLDVGSCGSHHFFLSSNNNSGSSSTDFTWFITILSLTLILFPQLAIAFIGYKNLFDNGMAYAICGSFIVIINVIGFVLLIHNLYLPVADLCVLQEKAASFVDAI